MKDKIKQEMEIIGADGVHVGTVDRVEGNRIKIKRATVSGGTKAIIISSRSALWRVSRVTRFASPPMPT